MTEHWDTIIEAIGGALTIVAVGLWKYLDNKKKKRKKVDTTQKSTDDIKEELETLLEIKSNPLEENEQSFTDMLMDEDSFIYTFLIKLMCQLKDDIMCSRITLFVTTRIEMGIEPGDIDENRRDEIIITHECKNQNVASEKDLHQRVTVHNMLPAIQGIKDGKGGLLVVNSKDDIKDPDFLGLFEYAGPHNSLKSVVDSGLYRPEFGQRKKYLIGGMVCAYVFDEHTFTDQDLLRITTVRDQIGAIIAMMYDEYVKNQ